MLCCRDASSCRRQNKHHLLSLAVLQERRLLLEAEGCSHCHLSSLSQISSKRTQHMATLQPFRRAWAHCCPTPRDG